MLEPRIALLWQGALSALCAKSAHLRRAPLRTKRGGQFVRSQDMHGRRCSSHKPQMHPAQGPELLLPLKPLLHRHLPGSDAPGRADFGVILQPYDAALRQRARTQLSRRYTSPATEFRALSRSATTVYEESRLVSVCR